MEEIRKRAAFIHVDIPGQEDGAADLPSEYVTFYLQDTSIMREYTFRSRNKFKS